jgi:hypothetical protein
VISRALGAESTVDIELKTIMFEPGTTFLLCSDGVTRHLDDWELESLLASGEDLSVICERIKKTCYDRGAEDNLTAVVVRTTGQTIAAGSNGHARVDREEEETTTATARSPFDEVAGPVVDTEPLVFGNGRISEDDPLGLSEHDTAPLPLSESQAAATAPTASTLEPVRSESPSQSHTRTTTEPRSSSRISDLLTYVGLFVLGLILGGVGIYYWAQSNPRVERVEVPVLQEKSSNVPLTAFEESRRAVDKDPEKFIAANAASPQDATDHYLLGRAYLLSGKYWDSKQALLKARDQLATADEADARTLSAEISMALSIINNGPAQEAFARDVATFNTNSQTNTNTAAAPR